MPPFTVRPPETPAEVDSFFRLVAETFASRTVPEAAATAWRQFMQEHPTFDPTVLRGIFSEGAYLGGYIIEERWLNIGGTQLRTGCIGGVVTAPHYRHTGVATALMEDALVYARSRNQALLLLHGFKFYRRFGYTDVLDMNRYTIDRAQIAALPASPDRVRPATPDDAPALLALYHRHDAPYIGSFNRSLLEQTHFVRFLTRLSEQNGAGRDLLVDGPPLVALGPSGEPSGSLLFPWAPLRTFGVEFAADSWQAAVALLQHAAHMVNNTSVSDAAAPATLDLPLIPGSWTFHLLADHLPLQRHTMHEPYGGWMARPVNMTALIETMLPMWHARWHGADSASPDVLPLTIDDAHWSLDLRQGGVARHQPGTSSPLGVVLSVPVFTQLLFGYRPATWAAAQADQQIPAEFIPVLTALFPPDYQASIIGMDGC